MPTASTSQILGNNECFEPYTSNIYVRCAGDRARAATIVHFAARYDEITSAGLEVLACNNM